MLTTTHLRCEYAQNPLGIDVDRPRLMWQLSAAGRCQVQSACQVQAASSAALLDIDAPDLWDSGKLASSAIQLEYGGRPLKSGEGCYWRVRVWDKDDQPGAYSAPAYFEMGLLSPADWRADWIGFPGAWPGRAVYFRKDFTIEKSVRKARIYMAGLGWSELRVNGQRVNDRVLDPPQSRYNQRVLYSTDAVETFLVVGANTIGVICGNGWYGTVRLLLQMNIEYEDGSTECINTEAGHYQPWLVGTGPLLENSVYDGETYDARLEVINWDAPDSLPSDYLPGASADLSGGKLAATIAACVDAPGGKLAAAMLEPIRVVETRQARSISQPRPGVYVFDIGQNMAGWAKLRVTGQRGTLISLRFAETLSPDGTINQENLRSARAEDRYILKGEGIEIWEPRFTYHGYRYIQVEGYPGQPTVEDVVGRVVRSDVSPTGRFTCSNEMYNRIDQMVWHTEASNLHSLPTDCPQRDERMGWLNDMAARAEGALYNFNLQRLLSKWMADIAADQDPLSGAITDTAPFRWGRRPADPVSVCYLLVPWLLYVHYGDERTLAERYDNMKAWVDYLTTRTEDKILAYSYYGDWSPPVHLGIPGSDGNSAVSKDTPGPLVSTACYFYSLSLIGQIAGVLGNTTDSREYAELAQQVFERFNASFWDEASGGYGSSNQSCNAIAYYMGLVPAERKPRVIASLLRNLAEINDYHLTTGNICTKYLLETLSQAGQTSAAARIAAQVTYPSWGFMLANGATTLWERWENETGGGMNSHNHPMMGSVAAWFYRHIAGIQADPSGPGFERLIICPNPAKGLTHASASLDTVRGKITCAWRVESDTFNLDLTIPAGSQARVCLPAPQGASVSEGDTLLWQNELPAALPDGILQVARSGDVLECSAGSGEYHFSIR